MVTGDNATGAELAAGLLQGVGNENMRAATRLLGAHRGGFWLRRLLEQEQELTTAADTVIDRTGTHPSIGWDTIDRAAHSARSHGGEARRRTAVHRVDRAARFSSANGSNL